MVHADLPSPKRRWCRFDRGRSILIALATFGANLAAGRDIGMASIFAFAGTVEPVVVALVLGAHHARPTLATMADARRLMLAALAGATVVGVLAGTTLALLVGGSFMTAAESVIAAHAAALLVILPVALLAIRPSAWRQLRGSCGLAEAIAQPVATAAVFVVVFALVEDLPLAYATLPLIIWGAIRLSPLAVSLEILVLGIVVTLLTRITGGLFGGLDGVSGQTAGLLVQSFLVVMVVAAMPLVLAMEQRHRALTHLIESQHRLEDERDFSNAVLDGTECLLVVVDHLGVIVRVNARVERLVGRTADELVGAPFWTALLTGQTQEGTRDRFLASKAGEPVELREKAWQTPAGVRRVLCGSERLRPSDPASPRVIAGLDVTNHRRAEELLGSVLDATTGNALIGTDPQGLITFFNTGAESLLGYRRDEVVGRTTPEPFHDMDEVVTRAAEMGIPPGFEVFVRDSRLSGEPDRRDWTYVRVDGSRITVSLTVSTMRDAHNGVHGYLGVAEDVTERRAAEGVLRTALEHEREAVIRLQQLDQIKSDFVSCTSHELRTPLTSVLGFTQLLAQETMGPLNADQLMLVSRVERSGHRLLGLIENLLTLSRVESGEYVLRETSVSVEQVVLGAWEAVEQTGQERNHELHFDWLGPRGATVLGDEEELERALINLLTNAIKFTAPGGRVGLEVAVTDDLVEVRITDTGVGIPVDEQSELFSRFFRASTASAHAIPGTGLGLTIVHTIIEAHRGTITVSSEPDVGSTFVVTLPTIGQCDSDELRSPDTLASNSPISNGLIM